MTCPSALLVSLLHLSGSSPEDAVTSPRPAPIFAGGTLRFQDAPPAPPRWTGSVNVGATATKGNSETTTVTAGFDAERRAEMDRWTAKAYWNYGAQEIDGKDEITTRKSGGSVKYDRFLSKKLYVLGVGGADADEQADLDLRAYAGAGAGYQFREDEALKWGGEGALTYFDENFGESEDNSYAAVRLASILSWIATKTTTLDNTVELFPSLEDSADFFGKSDTRVKMTLTESMFSQLQWVWNFDNSPADGKEESDHLFVLGIGWSF